MFTSNCLPAYLMKIKTKNMFEGVLLFTNLLAFTDAIVNSFFIHSKSNNITSSATVAL